MPETPPSSPEKFYVTTPIYYVNARPHIGHAYTTIAADVLARRHRLLGHDTFFLTGTDEHGQKIERSARAAGVDPQHFADQVSASFRALWDRMGITYTDFIRTTEPRHKERVQHLFRQLQERGAIYKSTYTGQYCVHDEAYVDGPPGIRCPDCGRVTETVSEENYYFKLSAFQQPLLNLLEPGPNGEPAKLQIQPDSRRNEVLSFIRGGLKDLSISRTSFSWGIPVPDDPKHVIYVWLDALANYMTAIGYGSDDPADQALFARFWPADIHLVGKEIIRFHCVYWPAFLLAAGLPPPRAVTAHGWLLFEESKMSKSRGNIVRTETILDAFGDHYRASIAAHSSKLASDPSKENASGKGRAFAAPQVSAETPDSAAAESLAGPTRADADLFASDVLRYFLLREIPFGQDGSFSFDALIERYNADLANGYGNLVSRTLSMIRNYCDCTVPAATSPPPDSEMFGTPLGSARDAIQEVSGFVLPTAQAFDGALSHYDFSAALGLAQSVVASADQMMSGEKPWKIEQSTPAGKARVAKVLYTAAESIRILTALLYPILPYTTAKVWSQLGLGSIEDAARNGDLRNLEWGGLQPGTKLGALAPIFPRAPKELAQIMTDKEASTPRTPVRPETPDDLTTVTADNDARTSEATEFAEAPLTSSTAPNAHPQAPDPKTAHAHSQAAPSRLSNEINSGTAPEPTSPWDPGAPPRTSALPHDNPIAQVGASSAPLPDLARTPSHRDAQASGLFAGGASSPLGPTRGDVAVSAFAPQITIDDFIKVDLRVARIVVAERIPKADKLLRLEVELGPPENPQRRQILSGIAEWYTPEELLGRRIIVIVNLAPRKMRGLESHGMLLAASYGEHGKPILATFADTDDIPPGARLK